MVNLKKNHYCVEMEVGGSQIEIKANIFLIKAFSGAFSFGHEKLGL